MQRRKPKSIVQLSRQFRGRRIVSALPRDYSLAFAPKYVLQVIYAHVSVSAWRMLRATCKTLYAVDESFHIERRKESLVIKAYAMDSTKEWLRGRHVAIVGHRLSYGPLLPINLRDIVRHLWRAADTVYVDYWIREHHEQLTVDCKDAHDLLEYLCHGESREQLKDISSMQKFNGRSLAAPWAIARMHVRVRCGAFTLELTNYNSPQLQLVWDKVDAWIVDVLHDVASALEFKMRFDAEHQVHGLQDSAFVAMRADEWRYGRLVRCSLR